MPRFPDISFTDISIDDHYTYGYDKQLCLAGLWDVYRLIQRFHNAGCKELLSGLYYIGIFGVFANADSLKELSVEGQGKDKKAGAFPQSPKKIFALEEFGFRFVNLMTADSGKSRSKLTTSDLIRYDVTYAGEDLPHVLLGIHIFARACAKHYGQPFIMGDIRVAFQNAPRYYAPPVEEIFYALPTEHRELAMAVHQTLEDQGCIRELEREYMLKYTHPKLKGQAYATIYTKTQFWFFGKEQTGEGITLKLNLRHIGNYINYLNECTQLIQDTVVNTEDCSGCKKACGGVTFQFRDKQYVKCPWYVFRFNDTTPQALANYIRLLELENVQLLEKGR